MEKASQHTKSMLYNLAVSWVLTSILRHLLDSFSITPWFADGRARGPNQRIREIVPLSSQKVRAAVG